MTSDNLAETRLSLHGVAELVLAGPQFAVSADIRLRVVPAGFATVAEPDLTVTAGGLSTPERLVPFAGSIADLAAAAALEPRSLSDVYDGGPGIGPEHVLLVDPGAATRILADLWRGEAALRLLAPGEAPVLWPEHFDVAITVEEVNYGVSPGDGFSAVPYAYVGPWQRHTGAFWNAPFGAARAMTELPTVESVLAFFTEGRNLARGGA